MSLEDQGRFFLGYYHQIAHRENQDTEESFLTIYNYVRIKE